MEIKGKIVVALPVIEGTNSQTGSTWKKQEYVLETMDQYPKKIHFSLWGDRVDAVPMNPGDIVEAKVNIESREYNERWYTTIRAWQITKVGTARETNEQPAPPPSLPPVVEVNHQPPTAVDPETNKGDDLPF
ncbi:MAG: DUF3127 domain-containing protein [Bacteroidales bacterium]